MLATLPDVHTDIAITFSSSGVQVLFVGTGV